MNIKEMGMEEISQSDNDALTTADQNQPVAPVLYSSRPLFILKDIAIMAVPKTVADFIQTADAIITAYMLANLKDNNILKASSLIYSTQNFFIGTGNAALNSVAICISQKFNDSTQHHKVGEIYRASLIYASAISLIPIATAISSKYVFLLCRQEENVASLAAEFFHRSVLGLPAAFYLTCAQQLLLGIDKAKYLPFIQLSTRALNTLLSYIFIFHGNRIHVSPLQGLGYAFSITMVANALLYNTLFKLNAMNHRYGLFSHLPRIFLSQYRQDSINHLKELAKLGAFIATQTSVELLYFEACNLVAGSINPISLVSIFTSSQYTSIPGILLSSLAMTASIKVSYALGNNELTNLNQNVRQKMVRYGNYTILSSVFITTIFFAIFVVFSRQLITLFLDDEQLIKDTQKFLIVGGIGQIFRALRETSAGALYGLKDTRTSMMVDIGLMIILGIPLGVLFTLTNQGSIGIYASAVITMVMQSIVLFTTWQGKTNSCSFTQNLSHQLNKLSICCSNPPTANTQENTYIHIEGSTSSHESDSHNTRAKKWYCFWQPSAGSEKTITHSKENYNTLQP
jgi:multidrug resistance protein, MATE family